MSHTTTITTSGGIIRHHNAIATKPGFCVQILEIHDCEAPKLILHEDAGPLIKLGTRDYKFWISK